MFQWPDCSRRWLTNAINKASVQWPLLNDIVKMKLKQELEHFCAKLIGFQSCLVTEFTLNDGKIDGVGLINEKSLSD